MCTVMMDATSSHFKSDCWRRTQDQGSGLRWTFHREPADMKEGSHHVCRAAAAARTIVRRYLQREKRRQRAARAAPYRGDAAGRKQQQQQQAAIEDGSSNRRPAGSMAPRNTTQYLMSKIWTLMKWCRARPFNWIELVP
ncbi:unnamed protein product [Ophioblennius macclurei]